jgi:hypothetical protein
MIIFIKLLLAHLLGDFILQPKSWVEEKEQKKLKSSRLYLHIAIHGLLSWMLIADVRFGIFAGLLAVTHGFIDFLKLEFQKRKTKRRWFVIDQILHLFVIVAITLAWSKIDFKMYEFDDRFWILATAVLLLTMPASIMIRTIISIWTPKDKDKTHKKEKDLENAGTYIGILERLFILCFILTGHFEAIGFLLAAKSIFRFGDLTRAKDLRLTEYVLIGTLMSFGIAIATGLLVQWALLRG